MSSRHDGAVVSTDHADESLSMHESAVAYLRRHYQPVLPYGRGHESSVLPS
jgi:hypothetical protein